MRVGVAGVGRLPLVEKALSIYDDTAKEGWGKRDGASLPAYWPHRTQCPVSEMPRRG